MKNLSTPAVLSGVLFAVALVCSGCGAEGGCGAPPPSTTPQITCGTGTHQEGNQCVRNAPRTNSSAGGGGSTSTNQPVGPQ